MNSLPRVPLSEPINLIGLKRTLQVNHCKNPSCGNFGIPARVEHGKPGPSSDRDTRYKLHSTSKGQTPSIRCKACGENPPIKSNTGIASEVERLLNAGGLLRPDETTGCGDASCENHARPYALHRDSYQKYGALGNGGGFQIRCKACGRRTSVVRPKPIRATTQQAATDVFGRIANKSPVRGAVRGSKCTGMGTYYRILDFIDSRCRDYSGRIDRALVDGRLSLPKQIVVESDAQEYTLNWVSRLDRRNVVLSSYCTVDGGSGFVFGLHVNYDDSVDPFQVNRESVERGDMDLAEAFRTYPQYWLTGDELRAGRAMRGKLHKHDRVELSRQIARLYEGATRRSDVEDIELHLHDDQNVTTPSLGQGVQIHFPYTIYAHWMFLHRMLTGAGVTHVQANMDKHSTSRAAFLSAYADEVNQGTAHGFYVRYTKFQTIDQRRRMLGEARRARAAFASTLPPQVRGDRKEVVRRMMLDCIDRAQSYGRWNDEWVEHPVPTINEPHKAVSWLTASNSVDGSEKVDMFLAAGLARIDNVFMKTRRLFSALERPVGASSGHNRVWHGYAPYNPKMLEKYLTIFRATHNFVFVGSDGQTPAMRLGIKKRPMTYKEILRAEQPISTSRGAGTKRVVKGWN